MKKIFYMLVSALTLTVCTARAQNATQSVVYLKDGSQQRCDILEMQNDTVWLKTHDGSIVVHSMKDVERIANASTLSGEKAEKTPSEVVRYKLRRTGRDLRIGRASLDLGQINHLFGRNLYKMYYSAYVLVGTGSAFITAGAIAAGVGSLWYFKGANNIMEHNGQILLVTAGASLATGFIMHTLGKTRISRIVRRYNSGMYHATNVEMSPCVIGFDDMVAQQQQYALGATVEFSF